MSTIIRKSSTYAFIWKKNKGFAEKIIWLISKQKQIQSVLSCHHLSVIQRKSMYLPLRILHFLGDIVERVPSRVGEEGRVESQGDHPWVCGWALEGSSQVFCFPCTNGRCQLPVTFQGLQLRRGLYQKCQQTNRKQSPTASRFDYCL